MTKEQAIELIEKLPSVTPPNEPVTKDRIDFYRKAVSKKDPVQWVKVIKSSYMRKNEKPLAATTAMLEKEYCRRAYSNLHAELAGALEIQKDEVETFIKNYLEKL